MMSVGSIFLTFLVMMLIIKKSTSIDNNNKPGESTLVNSNNNNSRNNSDNHFVGPKITRVKFACVVDRTTVVKVRHGPIAGHTSNWSLHDRIDPFKPTQLLSSISETDSTFNLTNSTDLRRDIDFSLSNKQSWMVHRIQFDRTRADFGGKELVLVRYSNGSSKKINDFGIETITIDNQTECSIYHPLRQPESNLTGDYEMTKLVRLRKSQRVRLYCSVRLRAVDLEGDEQNRPLVKWVLEKPAKITQMWFGNPNTSFARISSINSSSHYNYVYWSYIDYTSPNDDLTAWQHYDEPIVCHVGHNHYFDGSGGSGQANGIFYSTSRNVSKIPHLGCKIKLNIQFEPFVHPSVSLVQTFREIDRTALVECPIKANSHFPIK